MDRDFTAGDVPDQTGKTFFITGANTGIGLEAAKVIAGKGGRVLLGCRSRAKAEAALGRIIDLHPGANVDVVPIDLADLASVNRAAEAVARESRLDVLINNAGIMMCPYSRTADGFEIQMGTNHLGHFALTGRLMPLLKRTDQSRVIIISSMAHTIGNIDFDDLTWESRNYNTRRAYGDSKLANLYFTYELARRLAGEGHHPRAIAAHPGWTATELQRHSRIARFLNQFVAMPVEMGALPTLAAAFDERTTAGQFFGPAGRGHWRGHPVAHDSSEVSYDEEIAKRLWGVSEDLTGVGF